MTEKKKAIIVLNGNPFGKTSFDKVAKKSGYWVWNVNHKNNLSLLVKSLPIKWEGVYDKNFNDSISEIAEVLDIRFNYKRNYYSDMISNFMNDPKPNLLVAHGTGKEFALELQAAGAFTVYIAESNEIVKSSFDKVIVQDDNFEKNVIEFLKMITQEIE